jgi:hypothetical protein
MGLALKAGENLAAHAGWGENNFERDNITLGAYCPVNGGNTPATQRGFKLVRSKFLTGQVDFAHKSPHP